MSKRSGFVVTGHGRLEAAQSMQASVVPVEYQEYASEAEEYADLMADNRLAELSEMNTSALADMLQQMDTGEIPLEMSGYSTPWEAWTIRRTTERTPYHHRKTFL